MHLVWYFVNWLFNFHDVCNVCGHTFPTTQLIETEMEQNGTKYIFTGCEPCVSKVIDSLLEK